MEEEIFISEVTKEHLESIFQWCPPYEKERILYYKSPDIGGAMAYVIGKEVVGFLYYRKHTYSVCIEYIEVKESCRRNGIGTRFMEKALQHFKTKRKKVIHINCVTSAGGIDTTGHPEYAKDYGDFLKKIGLHEVTRDGYSPQKGDIRVWQNYPGGHRAGHIHMYNGSQWVSDFFEPNNNGPGRDYRKYNNYKIYRK